jgi:hypothetical protein
MRSIKHVGMRAMAKRQEVGIGAQDARDVVDGRD